MSSESSRESRRKSEIEYFQSEMADLHKGGAVPFDDFISDAEYQAQFRKYFKDLKYLEGKTFLDVGSGFGSKLHSILRSLGVNFINLDVSEVAAAFRQNLGESSIVGDLYHLPIKNETVDGVICANLLNTGLVDGLVDVKDIFHQISSAIKPGGYFIQTQNDPTYRVSEKRQIQALGETGFVKACSFHGLNPDGSPAGLAIIATKK